MVFMSYRHADAYTKLRRGQRVNIAIIGDSIGYGTGASSEESKWTVQLQQYLSETYGAQVNLDNYSLGGNTSYAGYVSVKKLTGGRTYDLAILCYGANDDEDDFGLYYESIIQALYDHNPGVQMIAIKENPLDVHNPKMEKLQELCDYYAIPVVDMIAPFAEKGYDELVVDSVHPNDAGYAIYFAEVRNCIDKQVAEHRKNKKEQVAVEERVSAFDRYENAKSLSEIDHGGVLGIHYLLKEGQSIAVYKDGELLVDIGYAGFAQEYYKVIDEDFHPGDNIKIVVEVGEPEAIIMDYGVSW